LAAVLERQHELAFAAFKSFGGQLRVRASLAVWTTRPEQKPIAHPARSDHRLISLERSVFALSKSVDNPDVVSPL
jgi:hypothetical protein